MPISVGLLRRKPSLQWWVLPLTLLLLLIRIGGGTVPSFTNGASRYILSKRSPDGSPDIFNSKQVEDTQPGRVLIPTNYYSKDVGQHVKIQPKLSLEIIPNYHQRQMQQQHINDNIYNRATEDLYKLEDSAQENDSETYLEIKKPTVFKPYKQLNSPLKWFVLEKPKPKPKLLHVNYETPFKTYSNNMNSAEIINEIMRFGRNDTPIMSPLQNAYLTKFTSYNITNLRNGGYNGSFLLEKKDNSSSNIIYLDSKHRSTNYSDTHSSILKTILETGENSYRQGLDTYNIEDKLKEDTENKFNQDSSINTQIKPLSASQFSDQIFTKAKFNQNNKKLNDLIFDDIDTDDKENYVVEDTDTYRNLLKLENRLASQIAASKNTSSNVENSPTTPVDFLGGQIIKLNEVKTTLSNLNNQDIQTSFVKGQFVNGIKYNKTPEATTTPDSTSVLEFDNVSMDSNNTFFQTNHTSEVNVNERTSTADTYDIGQHDIEILANKYPYSLDALLQNQLKNFDFHESNKESTPYLEVFTSSPQGNKYLEINYDTNLRESDEPTTTEQNQETFGEFNYTTSLLGIPQTTDLSKTGKADGDQAENDILVNNNTYSFDTLLQNQLKGFDFYNKYNESTPELDLFTTPIIKNEYLDTNNDKNQEGNDEVTSIQEIEENYEGMNYNIPLLEIPQAKNDSDKDTILVFEEQKENNFKTIYKKNKTIVPVTKPITPYRGMSSNSETQIRPINVFSESDNTYDPSITDTESNWTGSITLNPISRDNVVFKTIDGDTEVIVSVSNTPGNSPIHNTEKDVSNSNYDEYLEDDEIVGSSNKNESHSILVKDPDSHNYVTELAENYFTNQFTTDAKNIKDIVNSHIEEVQEFSSASPLTTIDNIVGESSDLFMSNHLKSDSVTSSSSLHTTMTNNTTIINNEPTELTQNPSEDTTISEHVELYAGSSFQNVLNDEDKPLKAAIPNLKPENINPPKVEETDRNSTSKGHLSELCIPLTNEKYISLLDLLSGPFYLDKDGKKIAISLRGGQRKNCSLNSKQCKLFVDLKDISSSQNKDSSMGLTKKDSSLETNMKLEKRHIADKPTAIVNSNPYFKDLRVFTNVANPNEFGVQTNEDKTYLDKQLPNTLTGSSLQQQSRNLFNEGLSPTYEEKLHEDQNHHYKSITHRTLDNYVDMHSTFTPIYNRTSNSNFFSKLNENLIDMFEHKPKSGYRGQFNIRNNPTEELIISHKNRPARMIDDGRSNKEEKCGCGENDILKSPSPFPNYKHFVAKRADILKNIVHTVSDWAGNS